MYHRLFETTTRRAYQYLDGWWNFCIDPENKGERRRFFKRFPAAGNKSVWVPHAWNSEIEYANYKGTAWYHKPFKCPFDGKIKINIGAAINKAKVWLNGKYLGEHEGGFLPFYFLAEVKKNQQNQLSIKVNNTYSRSTLPKDNVDWFPYGGITRTVFWEKVGEVFIEHMHIHPYLDGRLEIGVYVINTSGKERIIPLRLKIEDRLYLEEKMHITKNYRQTLQLKTKIEKPILWNLDQPHLYQAKVELEDDDYIQQFGVREFSKDKKFIYLNGERIKLHGFNRHEEHPDWGFAMPPHLIKKDFDILKNLNCNALRIHYPPDELVLDFCDRLGILHFSEIPSWQHRMKDMAQDPLKIKMKNGITDMIYRDYNHPSIFAWSFGNESPTEKTEEGGIELRPAMKEMVELIKKSDNTRFTTYVSSRNLEDKYLDLYDIVCFNLGIQWWNIEDTFEAFSKRFDNILAGIKKPLFISEVASMLSLVGHRSVTAERMTEDYDYSTKKKILERVMKEDIVGFCIWQFCDAKTDPKRILNHPRGYGNYGVVDEYRRPKLSYYLVKELFSKG